jgi:hypothetical protein
MRSSGARQMVGNFKPEDVDKVSMWPTQGFKPLVSAIASIFHFVCFQILFTDLVEVDA